MSIRLWAAALSAALMPALTQAEPSLVLLVRHADKAAEPGEDPGLTAAGQARAQALVEALRGQAIGTVITTPFLRTRSTARPLVEQRGLKPIEIRSVADTVAAIRQQTGVVLVVGHSNTLPRIAAGLGVAEQKDLCDQRFSEIWVMPRQAEGGYGLLQLQYGAPEPACP